jgi:FkbM family methyltransferase
MIVALMNAIGSIYATVFARPSFYFLNKSLFFLSLRGMGLYNCGHRVSGEKYFLNRILPKIVAKCPVLLDVGANVGSYSQMLAFAFPKATIYAFEPHPSTFQKLRKRIGDSVQCCNVAIGKNAGTTFLYDRQDNDGSEHASLSDKVITKLHKQKVVQHIVNIETVDRFAAEKNITTVDLLKIDTEGYEYDVLLGAKNLIDQKAIKIIQFEFGSMNTVTGHMLKEFKEMLPGYTLYRLLPKHLLLLDFQPIEEELFGYQNIIAVSDRVRHLI